MGDITISLGDAGLLVLGIALFILIIYLILLVKNCIPTLKSAAKIMQDVEVISGAAAEGTEEVKKVISDVSESAEIFKDSVKNNRSIIAAATSVINCLQSLRNLTKKEEK